MLEVFLVLRHTRRSPKTYLYWFILFLVSHLLCFVLFFYNRILQLGHIHILLIHRYSNFIRVAKFAYIFLFTVKSSASLFSHFRLPEVFLLINRINCLISNMNTAKTQRLIDSLGFLVLPMIECNNIISSQLKHQFTDLQETYLEVNFNKCEQHVNYLLVMVW